MGSGRAGAQTVVAPHPDKVTPATWDETYPILLGAVLLSFLALVISFTRGYVLLYGDAVAHLGIARRILDSRNPGLVQLGGVWLPLPHLLMLPFVQKIAALATTAFFALNPNLLYLSTTAMTEPLFLALFVWTTLLTLECAAAIEASQPDLASRRLPVLGVLVLASVYTRYDGWILGACVWCLLTWKLSRDRALFRRLRPAFVIFSLLAVAGPISSLAYNQHFMHDPLDFLRGPYSAAAIERKTMPPHGHHHRGWHNPAWALLFYTRTSQIDAAFWETGFVVMAAAIAGLALAVRRRFVLTTLLLWLPLPFYVYSVAYGSVPIFIPQLWPHAYYNSRYGIELLPALALFGFLAVAWMEKRWSKSRVQSGLLIRRLLQPVMLLLIILNSIAMLHPPASFVKAAGDRYSSPLVIKEALVNAMTRVPFEESLARQIKLFPDGATILMYNSEHVGALEDAGIPLRQTINEGDYDSFHAALADPAKSAADVVAIAGDPVSAAVAAHPQGLTELSILCTTGQPCARIYQSQRADKSVEH